MAKSWFKKMYDNKEDISRLGKIPSHHKFLKFGNKIDEEIGLPEIWFKNGYINIKWLDENKDRVIGSVYDLPKYEDRAIIICGMGESMSKQWRALKGINRDRFIIVAVNSSAKYLIDRGIIPDYVICIDGKPGHWTMAVGEEAKDSVAIFSACVDPQAIKDWPGKIMIVPYGVKDRSLKRRIERRWGKGIICGGNSTNAALGAFITQTEAKIYVWIGNELSFKKTYYGDGKESPHDKSGHFWATNIKGEKVKTHMPLFQYKIWAESIMTELYPYYHFVDCSGGILGLDTNNKEEAYCKHKKLNQAIVDIEEAWKVEQLPEPEKKKIMYDWLFSSGYSPINSEIQWKQVVGCIPFEKGLDVGCGTGVGIKYARDQGHDVWGLDLADARLWWKELGIDKYTTIASATKMPYEDNSFDLIVCGEVLEHIPEEQIDEVFAEMYRVTSDKLILTICLSEETWPAFGYIATHCTLKPPKWWIEKVEAVGFKIYQAHAGNPYNFKKMTGLLIYGVKDEKPYKGGVKQMVLDGHGHTKEEIERAEVNVFIDPGEITRQEEKPVCQK